jgi:hypothetical protein
MNYIELSMNLELIGLQFNLEKTSNKNQIQQ